MSKVLNVKESYFVDDETSVEQIYDFVKRTTKVRTLSQKEQKVELIMKLIRPRLLNCSGQALDCMITLLKILLKA